MFLNGSWRNCVVVAALAVAACSGGGGGSSAPPPTPTPTPAPAPVVRTVTFNANGGTGTAPAAATFTVGQTTQLPAAEVTATNYTFAGWNTRADGTGTAYAAATPVSLGTQDLTLYAQFKAAPLKITQTGDASEMRLLVEWHDGSKQDIVYRPELVGFGVGHHFTSVVGGLAVLASGGTHYVHTSYPPDYLPDHQPVMTMTSGGLPVLQASGPRPADRQGTLAPWGATLSADEVKFVVRGRIIEANADTEVEITLRADAPRMALARSKITYTRATTIDRIYHQGIYANPLELHGGPISQLYGKGGAIVDTGAVSDTVALPEDLTGGFFYKTEPTYFVGFIAPRSDAKDFYAWQRGDYLAAYKIVYDNVSKVAGDTTESRLVATFGFATADARSYLTWAEGLRLGNKPDIAQLPIPSRGAARAITEAFGVQ